MDSKIDANKVTTDCKAPNQRMEHEWRLVKAWFNSEPRRNVYEFYCIHCLKIVTKEIPLD